MGEIITAREAAELLGCTRQYIQRLVQDGRIPLARTTKPVGIDRELLLALHEAGDGSTLLPRKLWEHADGTPVKRRRPGRNRNRK